MTEEENKLCDQLLLAGQLHALIMLQNNPRDIKMVVKQLDPDVLQGFVDSKPEGFLYTELVQQAIRLARTFKSLSSKG